MAKQKTQPSPFIEWINDKGVFKVAELLDIDVSTVRHWRLGNSYPKVTHMRKIKQLTKGVVTYDHIIDGPTMSVKGNV